MTVLMVTFQYLRQLDEVYSYHSFCVNEVNEINEMKGGVGGIMVSYRTNTKVNKGRLVHI